MSRKQMGIPVSTGLLLLVSLTGCATLSDHHYERTQWKRARTAFRNADASCSRYPSDYKKGWIDGYYEVVTGGPSCPPAFAPAEYWRPKQILDDCDNRRHEYYSGWQDGAACATQQPDTHYLKLFETCECSFPKCDCTEACSAGQGCQSVQGMALYPGAIEASGDIMIMPTPEEQTPPATIQPIPAPAISDEVLPPAAADAPVAAEEAIMPEPAVEMPEPAAELPPTPAGIDADPEPETSPSDRIEEPTVLSDFETKNNQAGLIE
ncbi:MAG: hypothetical protein AAFX06_07070 [Planctomycetota bacterium]